MWAASAGHGRGCLGQADAEAVYDAAGADGKEATRSLHACSWEHLHTKMEITYDDCYMKNYRYTKKSSLPLSYRHTYRSLTLAECMINLLLILWECRSAWGYQFSLPQCLSIFGALAHFLVVQLHLANMQLISARCNTIARTEEDKEHIQHHFVNKASLVPEMLCTKEVVLETNKVPLCLFLFKTD